jgi:hypothetical protein
MRRNTFALLILVMASELLLLPPAPRAQQFALKGESFTSGYTDGISNEYVIVGVLGDPAVVTAVSNDFGINALLVLQEPPTGIDSDPTPAPANFLASNYPNPFNPVTIIRYGIKERSRVSLRIYDVAGRLVRTLVDEVQEPGVEYSVKWHGLNDSGRHVSSGVYFCRLIAGGYTESRKMVLLR